jgi:hypothetical protein
MARKPRLDGDSRSGQRRIVRQNFWIYCCTVFDRVTQSFLSSADNIQQQQHGLSEKIRQRPTQVDRG